MGTPPTTASTTGRREGSDPLEGLVVLEVGAFMAAPFATMHPADLDARCRRSRTRPAAATLSVPPAPS